MSDEDDEDLQDEDEGEEGEEESAHEVLFDEETEGVLIAGKRFDTHKMLRRELGAFAQHVEAVAEKSGLRLALVPSGDLTDTGPSPDDVGYAAVHVGFEGGRGGTYGPDTIARDVTLGALEKAQKVPADVWSAISAGLQGEEKEEFDAAPVALHFTCVGPLAAATLAFGVLGTEDGSGPGEYLVGQDMEQERHAEGVWGRRVAYVQYESPESEEVDLSDAAHEERAKELGVPEARYFILARYD